MGPIRAPMPRAGRFLRARRLRGFADDARSEVGEARSLPVTRSSGLSSSSSSNDGSRRVFAAFFFAAIRNLSRAGGMYGAGPRTRYAGRFKVPLRNGRVGATRPSEASFRDGA